MADRIKAVAVLVGPKKEALSVDEDLLCAKVPFFHNAFEGNYTEARTKTFTFPDDEPERFRDLITWLEHGSLSAANADPTWLWLSTLWVFADKYHIDELQNEIVDMLHSRFAARRSGVNISYETLDYVVENTHQRSPLRRLFVDMLTNGISLQQLPSRVESIPSEMLQDMVINLKETIHLNDPTGISLLTSPIESYYTSSAHCKANAMPVTKSPLDQPTPFFCDGSDCTDEINKRQPIQDSMYICTHHQVKYCETCAPSHRGHRLKLISLTTAAYKDDITGPNVTVIDGHINDSGFYCDGPDCDRGQDQKTHTKAALMFGDRYNCLDCWNIDYCGICVRGELKCKDAGHSMLRIRPTFAKRNALREVSIPTRQARAREGLCWRCGSREHGTEECEVAVQADVVDVEVEE